MLFNDSVYNLNTSLNSNLDWNQILKQSFEIIKPLQVTQINQDDRFVMFGNLISR